MHCRTSEKGKQYEITHQFLLQLEISPSYPMFSFCSMHYIQDISQDGISIVAFTKISVLKNMLKIDFVFELVFFFKSDL